MHIVLFRIALSKCKSEWDTQIQMWNSKNFWFVIVGGFYADFPAHTQKSGSNARSFGQPPLKPSYSIRQTLFARSESWLMNEWWSGCERWLTWIKHVSHLMWSSYCVRQGNTIAVHTELYLYIFIFTPQIELTEKYINKSEEKKEKNIWYD